MFNIILIIIVVIKIIIVVIVIIIVDAGCAVTSLSDDDIPACIAQTSTGYSLEYCDIPRCEHITLPGL